MRKILTAMLLVASTAAVPAFAQDHHHDGDGHHGGGGQPHGPPQPHGGPPPGGGFHGGDRPQSHGGPPPGGGFHGGGDHSFQAAQGQAPGGRDGYHGPIPGGGYQPGGPNRPIPNGGPGGWHGGNPEGPGGPGGWHGGNPGGPGGWHGGGGDWNRGWRGDHRYDWQGWRDSHRDSFHIGAYRPPYGYGWGYRRFGIGFTLDAGFFAQQYWIGDPGYYRLPPAYGPYRWVRYYNDALLVNIYNGQIVDEIPDFFW